MESQSCKSCGAAFECVFDEAETQLCLNCSFKAYDLDRKEDEKESKVASPPQPPRQAQQQTKESQNICGDLMFYPLTDASGTGWALLCDVFATYHQDAVKYIVTTIAFTPAIDPVQLGQFIALEQKSPKHVEAMHQDCKQHMSNIKLDFDSEWRLIFQRLQMTIKNEQHGFAFLTDATPFWIVPFEWTLGCLSRLPNSIFEMNALHTYFSKYLKQKS